MKMDERDLLIELEEPLRRIHCGINAIELMMYGLGRVKDPRADGFYVVWSFLWDTELAIRDTIDILRAARE